MEQVEPSMNDYKKRQEEKKAKIAKLLKDNPSNKVIQELDESKKKEKMMENSEKMADWDLIWDAYHAAKHIYMEGELSLGSSIDQLIDSLTAMKLVMGDKSSNKNSKPADKKEPMVKPDEVKAIGY